MTNATNTLRTAAGVLGITLAAMVGSFAYAAPTQLQDTTKRGEEVFIIPPSFEMPHTLERNGVLIEPFKRTTPEQTRLARDEISLYGDAFMYATTMSRMDTLIAWNLYCAENPKLLAVAEGDTHVDQVLSVRTLYYDRFAKQRGDFMIFASLMRAIEAEELVPDIAKRAELTGAQLPLFMYANEPVTIEQCETLQNWENATRNVLSIYPLFDSSLEVFLIGRTLGFQYELPPFAVAAELDAETVNEHMQRLLVFDENSGLPMSTVLAYANWLEETRPELLEVAGDESESDHASRILNEGESQTVPTCEGVFEVQMVEGGSKWLCPALLEDATLRDLEEAVIEVALRVGGMSNTVINDLQARTNVKRACDQIQKGRLSQSQVQAIYDREFSGVQTFYHQHPNGNHEIEIGRILTVMSELKWGEYEVDKDSWHLNPSAALFLLNPLFDIACLEG